LGRSASAPTRIRHSRTIHHPAGEKKQRSRQIGSLQEPEKTKALLFDIEPNILPDPQADLNSEWYSGQIRGSMGYWPGPGLDLPQPEIGKDLWEKF
jgi:hypothetical protein